MKAESPNRKTGDRDLAALKSAGRVRVRVQRIVGLREWRDRYTLPVDRKWYVIELWLNLAWFRLTTEYDRQEYAEAHMLRYSMPTPRRIIECRIVETEVFRADSTKQPNNVAQERDPEHK